MVSSPRASPAPSPRSKLAKPSCQAAPQRGLALRAPTDRPRAAPLGKPPDLGDNRTLDNEFELADASIVALGDGRALVFDDVLGRSVATAVRAEALMMLANGQLRRAGIGRGASVVEQARGDAIAWVEPDTLAFAPVIERFTALMATLNRLAYLGARRLEIQVAVYAPGFGYVRHMDALAGSSSRRATVIYYANDWRPGDGGELEVIEPDCVCLIEPIADRLVVFRADVVEHAVLAVQGQPRVAISGWLRADGVQ